jgi:predicted O-methyltransferase YrrM
MQRTFAFDVGTPTSGAPRYLPMGPDKDRLERAGFESEIARMRREMQLGRTDLDLLFAELDAMTGARGNERARNHSAMLRLGSVAAHAEQVQHYASLASRPSVRTICEVGFNAGHSAAVWLMANPNATLHTFDLWSHGPAGRAGLQLLKTRFPGRILAHVGDSLHTIARTTIAPPCDLVHIDGRHDYAHTLTDFVNFVPKARADAVYLFDDQCDPERCASTGVVPAEPTLATCDLQLAGVLLKVETHHTATRMWSLFRRNTSVTLPKPAPLRSTTLPSGDRRSALATHNGRRSVLAPSLQPLYAVLPCARACKLRWTSMLTAKKWYNLNEWWRHSGRFDAHRWQREVRPLHCHVQSCTEV